jgi:hypothetical protein
VAVLERYAWVPESVWEFVRGKEAVVAPDQKSWLLTVAAFCGASDSAYAWDEWERASLAAADGDADWRAPIKAFWDEQLPLALSIRNGYGYRALNESTQCVVAGSGPEFEEAADVAPSFTAWLDLVVSQDRRLGGLLWP